MINDVKVYWENHPLFSYEVKYPPGSREFFQEMDRIKREDVERFSMSYWDFPKFESGQFLLDIGCGPGFLTRFYASKGYKVTAIDLSEKAVGLTKCSLQFYSLKAEVKQGNAERLEFKDNSFDYVVSSGVLHHTPDTEKAVNEAFRVLKPGGKCKITLYYKNILLRKPVWYLTAFLAKKFFAVPGRSKLSSAGTPDDFIRFYDGNQNPVGKGYTLREVRRLISPPFTWIDHSVHYFPARFLPIWLPVNKTLHRYLDKTFGTMIYLNLVKK